MIIGLSHKIRDLCISRFDDNFSENSLFFTDRTKWYNIYRSLDLIHDTQIAIDYYLQLDDFDTYTGGYLFIYGLFQSLFIQQDAIISLSKALLNKDINIKNDYPELYRIRENRNISMGHPVGRKSFIARNSISKNEFELCQADNKTRKINIINDINTQIKFVTKWLEEILQKLTNE